jgi:hypothetical protein
MIFAVLLENLKTLKKYQKAHKYMQKGKLITECYERQKFIEKEIKYVKTAD